MGAKNYFRNQFSVPKFLLESDDVSDFYLTSWQQNRSTLPGLCIRLFLFLGCLAIVLTSMIMTGQSISFGYWPIFLTHWGLLFITVACGFACAVSTRAFLRGPIEASFALPWYVKAHWVSFNIATTIAFFITIFYWIFLTGLEEEFAINAVLDVFIHGINSVVMLCLLLSSKHPVNIYHFYHPLLAGVVYLVFSVIYYFAGGTDPQGNPYIYPMLNWEEPGVAAIVVVASAIGIIVVHLIVVAISVGRDALLGRYRRNSRSLSISNAAYM